MPFGDRLHNNLNRFFQNSFRAYSIIGRLQFRRTARKKNRLKKIYSGCLVELYSLLIAHESISSPAVVTLVDKMSHSQDEPVPQYVFGIASQTDVSLEQSVKERHEFY